MYKFILLGNVFVWYVWKLKNAGSFLNIGLKFVSLNLNSVTPQSFLVLAETATDWSECRVLLSPGQFLDIEGKSWFFYFHFRYTRIVFGIGWNSCSLYTLKVRTSLDNQWQADIVHCILKTIPSSAIRWRSCLICLNSSIRRIVSGIPITADIYSKYRRRRCHLLLSEDPA